MKKTKKAAKPIKQTKPAKYTNPAKPSKKTKQPKAAKQKAAKQRKQKEVKPKKQTRFSSLSKGQRTLIILVIMGVFAYFIYQPFCLWYGAMRDNQIYQEAKVRYDQDNAEKQARVDELNSDEGIKEEARNHGYAELDESTATVEGLPGQDKNADESPIPKEITQAVIDEPDPFYVQIFDFLFLYHKGQ